MEKVKKEGQGSFDITVKISGKTLKQAMVMRIEKEKTTGRIASIAEIVREAINVLYERGESK